MLHRQYISSSELLSRIKVDTKVLASAAEAIEDKYLAAIYHQTDLTDEAEEIISQVFTISLCFSSENHFSNLA